MLALALLLALVAPTGAADHIEPQVISGPDNHTCSSFTPEGGEWGELKVDPVEDGEWTSADGILTIGLDVNDAQKVFDWFANEAIVGFVFVKAGQGGHHLYEYDPLEIEDRGLTTPGDGATENQISHVLFCYDAAAEDPTCGGEGQPVCPPTCGTEGQPECPPTCGGEGQPECPPEECGEEGQPACPPTCGGEGQPACPPTCGGEGQPACPPTCGGEGQPECPPEECGEEGQPACPPTCGGEGQPECPPTCGGEGQPECPPEECGEEGQPACPPTCGGEGQPECPPTCGTEGQPECPSETGAVCPAGLVATPDQDGSIRLDFEPAADSDSSVVYRALGDGEFAKMADLEQDVATWEDTTSEAGETYRYTVTAMFGEAEAEDCPVAEATAIPDFPTVLAAGGAVGASLLAYAFARRKS